VLIKKKGVVWILMVVFSRLLPHPPFGHLLPNGEGDTNKIYEI